MTRPSEPCARWSSSRPRGISLVETVVAVVVFGIAATILTRTLVGGQRIHRAHVQDVVMSESARAALAILPGEFRELSAGDGDILAMDSGSITYRSMQGLHVLCVDPDTTALTVHIDGQVMYGSRPLDVPDDSVVVFADGDPASRLDDAWIAAGTVSAASGTACPGGAPSIRVALSGITPAQLARVRAGAPLRAFRLSQLLAYLDARRDWWLGQRQFQASSGTWSTVQPVLGPLVAAGLALAYLDAVGHATDGRDAVSRIGIRVTNRSPHRVHRPAGATYLTRVTATHVVLRNNPRY